MFLDELQLLQELNIRNAKNKLLIRIARPSPRSRNVRVCRMSANFKTYQLTTMKQRYFFFDLDGTLRKTKSGKTFIDTPDDQEAIPGTQGAVKYFASLGFKIVGVSNQGGCAAIDPNTGHPYKSIDNTIVEQQVTLELFPEMEKIMFCPTYKHPSYCYEVTRDSTVLVQAPIDIFGNEISCRKPGHGMIIAAVRNEKEMDFDGSWMTGDRNEDQLCASGAMVNFIWANLFHSYFGGNPVEKPQQPTVMINRFEDLITTYFVR